MRVTLEIDSRSLRRELDLLAKRSVPYAMRDALNAAAFRGREVWQDEIRKTFTLRNQFTVRSVRVDKARGTDTRAMVATLGSVADYMGVQEEGGTVRANKSRKPIPAPTAAGQRPAGKRTKAVRAGLRLAAVQAGHPRLSIADRKKRNFAAMVIARRKGKRFAMLERPSGGVGLFRIHGTKKKPVGRLLYDLSKTSVKVPGSHTLEDALKRLEPELPKIAERAFVWQLARQGIIKHV